MVSFNLVPSLMTSMPTCTMATEPCTMRRTAPKIEAIAGTKTAKRVKARMRFIEIRVGDALGLAVDVGGAK